MLMYLMHLEEEKKRDRKGLAKIQLHVHNNILRELGSKGKDCNCSFGPTWNPYAWIKNLNYLENAFTVKVVFHTSYKTEEAFLTIFSI